MIDLNALTVAELRKLARQHLGRGHSRLTTKSELISALKKKLAPPSTRAGVAPKKRRAPRKSRAGARSAKLGAKARDSGRPKEPSPPVPGIRDKRPIASSTPLHPLTEGFFDGAQPTLIVSAAPRSVPSLQDGYGTDRLVATPRDPSTLFVFWDFAQKTLQQAAVGLASFRMLLRVYTGDSLLREVQVDGVYGSLYLQDLPLRSRCRVELHAVGDNGSRCVAVSSIPEVFPEVASTQLRFASIPLETPLRAVPQALQRGSLSVRRPAADVAEGIRQRLSNALASSSPTAPWAASAPSSSAPFGRQ